MIYCVSNIMRKAVTTIDAYDGVCKAQRTMDENNVSCLPVLHNGKLVGVLTCGDIRKTHPNRIVADAMTKRVISVAPETSLWQAKRLFEQNKIKTLLVKENDRLVGLVSKSRLYAELGKHYDLLTGLYRSEYIYQMGIELLENGSAIAVIFIDLNEFGQIDKAYGHIQGDLILKEVAVLLQTYAPADAYLCRFGGDEFVLLTGYNPAKCEALAEVLVKAIASHKFSDNIKITAAAGLAASRQQNILTSNPREMVINLVNSASLASTRAKQEKLPLVIAEGYLASETAWESA
ncbi:CBS domain-containing protein [Desulfotomaculum varum]